MQYALLLYSTEDELPERMDEADRKAFYADFAQFNKALEEAGVLVSALRLDTSETATTVRMHGAEVLTTDGPFAETKENLAGFFLLECGDLDEALAWAKRIPSARIGSVEVRPTRY